MPGRFVFIDDPSNADYLHLAKDLAELRGKSSMEKEPPESVQ